MAGVTFLLLSISRCCCHILYLTCPFSLYSLYPRSPQHPGVRSDSVSSEEGEPQPTSDQIPSQRELEAKIQCASTLLAWSIHKDNAQRLAKVRKFGCSIQDYTASRVFDHLTINNLSSQGFVGGCRRNEFLSCIGYNGVSDLLCVALPRERDAFFVEYRGAGFIPFQEGAVEAVLRLCKTDHLVLRGYCSAILKQFAATPILREKLVARGGVSK